MSVWHGFRHSPLLEGSEGELLLARVSVEPRALEDLLECLAGVSFPINPQIYHGVPTLVEFPVWAARLFELHDTLAAFGFDPSVISTSDMLSNITG